MEARYPLRNRSRSHYPVAKTAVAGTAFILILFLTLGMRSERTDHPEPSRWDQSSLLNDVLAALGDSVPTLTSTDVTVSAEHGYNLIHRGFTVRDGNDTTRRISRHFVCTDCHNTVREDPDLRASDPEARLDYAVAHNLPFLQGTTLYGVVNRSTWYNGFYLEKYKPAAEEAHRDLVRAVQLCASECSQGRLLDQWELESVFAYLESIGYRLGDLDLGASVWKRLEESTTDTAMHDEMIEELQSYYLHGSPATLAPVPDITDKDYANAGDSARGSAIYRLSCLHCHGSNGSADFELDYDLQSFKKLRAKSRRATAKGLFHIILRGTEPNQHDTAYMPLYTRERLSPQQFNDLISYIHTRSK